MTVNNQIVVGTLMNLSDNPTRVSIGQDWQEKDITHRIPIIVTGNDLSTIYAPLIRDGRMDKFYWCVLIFRVFYEYSLFSHKKGRNYSTVLFIYVSVRNNLDGKL